MSVREAVEAALPSVLADLSALVAIESVSADPNRSGEVERSAGFVAGLLHDLGCPDVRVVRAGGAPAVIGRFPAPPGAPTVCLYGHHDVQPEGDPGLWTAPPFTVDARGDRLFARGVTDDKGGVAVHLAALRAFGGQPPVGVTVFIEGEEEIGSPWLEQTIATFADDLAADAFVIMDAGNWAVGQPAFTTSLRGLVDCVVEVRTLDHAVHSGSYGGVVPDALMTLCRLLASLHDEQGNVAVAGLHVGDDPGLAYPEDRLAVESGKLPGTEWIGSGSFTQRLWAKPSLSVLAIDATPVSRASNTLIPAARAKISVRLAPGQVAADAMARLVEHLEAHVPWGAQLHVFPGDAGEPSSIACTGPYADAYRAAMTEAWGVAPVLTGEGGSIPMVAAFAERFPDATILVLGVADPDTRAHGIDESLHVGDFRAACLAEALFLEHLAPAPASA